MELPDSSPGAASLILPVFTHLPGGPPTRTLPGAPALWSLVAS